LNRTKVFLCYFAYHGKSKPKPVVLSAGDKWIKEGIAYGRRHPLPIIGNDDTNDWADRFNIHGHIGFRVEILRRLAGIEQQIVDCTLDAPGVDPRSSVGAYFDIDRDTARCSMAPHCGGCSLGGQANMVMRHWIVSVATSESQEGIDGFGHHHHSFLHLQEYFSPVVWENFLATEEFEICVDCREWVAQIMGYEASHPAYGCYPLSLADPGCSIHLLSALELLIPADSENLSAG
jgi:hypothetical protein